MSPLTGNLVNGVTSNRLAADFEQLCNLVADWPVLSKLCILQPVFYVHLDPGCIPEKSTPDATTNIEPALWSFVGLRTQKTNQPISAATVTP
jgi:hypothetical protein